METNPEFMPPPPPLEAMTRILEAQRAAFRLHPMPSAAERIDDLNRLKRSVLDYRERLCDAVNADFMGGRSRDETLLAEIFPSVSGIDHARRHVRRWMRASRRRVGALFLPARARVRYQPLGVVGIISPWNYPVYLTMGPLTGALAAGNRVMIKASESTPRTTAVLTDMLATIFPQDHVAVIAGDAAVGAAFSDLELDHLLFTGSTQVGRHVMRAAASRLTPVTLELGGKSPAILGDDADVADAARTIAFGKALNAGQTCIAPDYVLCPEAKVERFADAMETAMARMYPDRGAGPDYTGLIHDRHQGRLRHLLDDAREKGARVRIVGSADAGDGKLPLHLILSATDEMTVMREEIFGPLLPVIPCKGLSDAIGAVNHRPRPLALYYFGHGKADIERIFDETHAGGVCINDVLGHVAQDDLPFGGIGPSGMGRYHGREGFLTFSHPKAVFSRGLMNSTRFIYPPYGRWVHRLLYRWLFGRGRR